MVLSLWLFIYRERTEVLLWCSVHPLLTLPNPSNFSSSATKFDFLSDLASGSEKYHLISLWENIVPPLAYCFPASLCAYTSSESGSMPFLVILHFPTNSFSAFLCSLLQEADLCSLCHLRPLSSGFWLGLVMRGSDRRWKEEKTEL